ncbi:hypothetical protein Nepgr_023958 [Nepenthes gracilis]|uniref:Uncharacterized protein n=1 Tax=Nepenthes gracilis TaxID=150966 RepID=A0AAD3T2C0_NEPGR|nr:hypothetical protein Nepgr_023958 [Nepenthes gracilis]
MSCFPKSPSIPSVGKSECLTASNVGLGVLNLKTPCVQSGERVGHEGLAEASAFLSPPAVDDSSVSGVVEPVGCVQVAASGVSRFDELGPDSAPGEIMLEDMNSSSPGVRVASDAEFSTIVGISDDGGFNRLLPVSDPKFCCQQFLPASQNLSPAMALDEAPLLKVVRFAPEFLSAMAPSCAPHRRMLAPCSDGSVLLLSMKWMLGCFGALALFVGSRLLCVKTPGVGMADFVAPLAPLLIQDEYVSLGRWFIEPEVVFVADGPLQRLLASDYFGRIGYLVRLWLVYLTLSWDAVVRWLNCFAIGSTTLLMDGAPSSQALVYQLQLDSPLMIWNSTSVDAEILQIVGCWQHHDSLLKGDVKLLKLLLKSSRLQILVVAIRITTLWFQHDVEELTAVGVRPLASSLLLVFCIWCGQSGACAVPYFELC